MRFAFYVSLAISLFFILLGVAGEVFTLYALMEKHGADVGMKVDSATMLKYDLADFWADLGWLACLFILIPSLLLTITLGILLRRRARAAGRG